MRLLVEQLERWRTNPKTSQTPNGARWIFLNWDVHDPGPLQQLERRRSSRNGCSEVSTCPLPIDSSFYGAIEGDAHTYVCRGQGNSAPPSTHDIQAGPRTRANHCTSR